MTNEIYVYPGECYQNRSFTCARAIASIYHFEDEKEPQDVGRSDFIPVYQKCWGRRIRHYNISAKVEALGDGFMGLVLEGT